MEHQPDHPVFATDPDIKKKLEEADTQVQLNKIFKESLIMFINEKTDFQVLESSKE